MRKVFIKRSPIAENISIACELVCIEYKFADKTDSPWAQIVPDLTYDKTNDFVNNISDFFQSHDFFKIKGTSLWQYLPSYIWPDFFAFNVFTDAIDRLIGSLRKCSGPLHFVDQSERDRYTELWENLLESKLQNISFQKRPSIFTRIIAGLKKCIKSLGLHHLKDPQHNTHPLPPFETGSIMFVSHGRYFDYDKSGKLVEVNFSPVRDELSSKYDLSKFIGIDCPYISSRVWKDSRYVEDMNWIPFFAESDTRKMVNFLAFMGSVYFYSLLMLKRRKTKVFPSVLCRCIIWPFFRDILPGILRINAHAEHLIARLNPRAVIAIYETGPYARALLIAASKRRIPTFGIMHGQIFENHYDYMHRNIYQSSSNESKGFIIPDVFFAWGDLWKNILTKSGSYPDESVIVSGQIPRHLKQATAESTTVSSKDRDDHVLIMTAWYRTNEFLEAIFEVAKNRKLFQKIVVKPHPSEDLAGIQATIARFPQLDIDIAIGDLSAALVGAHLAVGQFSTSIFESALLKIPTVLFNYPKCQGASFFRTSLCWKYLESSEELIELLDRDFEEFRKWTVEKAEVYRPMFLGDSRVSSVVEISRTIYSFVRGMHSAE